MAQENCARRGRAAPLSNTAKVKRGPGRPRKIAKPKRGPRPIDWAAIEAVLEAHAESFVSGLFQDGERRGNEWVARNPNRSGDDNPGSLSINLKNGIWKDFAGGHGDAGRGFIRLYAYRHGCTRSEAARNLAQKYGVPLHAGEISQKQKPAANTAAKSGGWQPIIPAPASAPTPPARHPRYGAPSRIWTYRDAHGNVICHVCRFDPPAGRKTFSPLTFCREQKSGTTAWKWQGPGNPTPLYGIERLAANPGATVILCEGEKSADEAADRYFPAPDFVCMSAMGGAQAIGNADFSPLNSRAAVFWPDNDKPGRNAIATAAPLILSAGATSVCVASVPAEWPAKWDLADPLPDGISADDIRRMAAEAPVFEAKPEQSAAGAPEAQTQASQIIALAGDVEFFHTPDDVAYAHVVEGERCRTLPVRGREFNLLMRGRYYRAVRGAPTDEVMRSAMSALEARALFDGKCVPVFLRSAEHDGRFYINLGRDDGAVVEISSEGWDIRRDAPVRFRRPRGMLPMPEPQRGSTIAALTRHLNVSSKNDFVLIVAWLLGAMSPRGPYPIAGIRGEQGSAKSTASWILRNLVDPNSVPLRPLPREERDLAIQAQNSHVLCFDNLSELPVWLSDAFCRIATGGGFSTRELYTDDGEKLFSDRRPQIMNGIDDFATRGDIASRCMIFELAAIPDDKRRTEANVQAAFVRERAGLLGVLFDAMAHGLRELPKTKLEKMPRMADFAIWAVACEGAFSGVTLPWKNAAGKSEQWTGGDFMHAYTDNRSEVVASVLDADPVAAALLSHMENRSIWMGTATDLQIALTAVTTEAVRRGRDWPGTAKTLGNRLKRLTPDLRKIGFEIERYRAPGGRARIIKIQFGGEPPPRREDENDTSQSSHRHKPQEFNHLSVTSGCDADALVNVTGYKGNGQLNGSDARGPDVQDSVRDDACDEANLANVTAKLLKNLACDDRDDCDNISSTCHKDGTEREHCEIAL